MKKQATLLLIFLLWVGLTTLVGSGGTWALFAILTIPAVLQAEVLAFLLPFFSFPLIALSTGAAQALLLSTWLEKRNGCCLASSAGMLMVVPFFLWFWWFAISPASSIKGVFSLGSEGLQQATLFLGAGAALVGALVGLAQSHLMGLRRRRGSQWVLATALCWGVSWPLSFQGGYVLQSLNDPPFASDLMGTFLL